MADGVFNVSKGRANEFVLRVDTNDPTNAALVVMLLESSVADATLEDFDDFSALLGDAGNTEAAFTNYARKVLTDADVASPTPDDTNNRQDADIGDQTYTSAGGASNETLAKLIIGYDSDSTSGTDSGIVPMTHHDFVITTDGTDIVAQINAAGFFRAS